MDSLIRFPCLWLFVSRACNWIARTGAERAEALRLDAALRADLGRHVTLPDRRKSVADRTIDMAVNTVSFREMTPAKIAGCFAMVRRALKPGGHFFTCNRAEKVMDGVPVRFADYPWVPRDEDVLFERSRLHDMLLPDRPFILRLCRLAPA